MLTNTFTPFPVLKTERLTLRQLSVNDDKEVFALRSDKQVNKYIDRNPTNTIERLLQGLTANAREVGVERGGYVYITINKHHTTLYTGVTSELRVRVYRHKTKAFPLVSNPNAAP
jgi:ribosomal-protein-alanine N-acetyltransferase